MSCGEVSRELTGVNTFFVVCRDPVNFKAFGTGVGDPANRLDSFVLVQHCSNMIKSISRIGNSQGLLLDSTLMDLARLKVGDQVNVEVHDGGTITLTPVRATPSREEVSKVIKATMKDYSRTMKQLA